MLRPAKTFGSMALCFRHWAAQGLPCGWGTASSAGSQPGILRRSPRGCRMTKPVLGSGSRANIIWCVANLHWPNMHGDVDWREIPKFRRHMPRWACAWQWHTVILQAERNWGIMQDTLFIDSKIMKYLFKYFNLMLAHKFEVLSMIVYFFKSKIDIDPRLPVYYERFR